MAKVARELLFLGAMCLVLQLAVGHAVDDAAAAVVAGPVDTNNDAGDAAGAVDEANVEDEVEEWLARGGAHHPAADSSNSKQTLYYVQVFTNKNNYKNNNNNNKQCAQLRTSLNEIKC